MFANKFCVNCGDSFQVNTPQQQNKKYCSHPCQRDYTNAKKEAIQQEILECELGYK